MLHFVQGYEFVIRLTRLLDVFSITASANGFGGFSAERAKDDQPSSCTTLS